MPLVLGRGDHLLGRRLPIIVWGKNDTIFPADGTFPYKRDLPNVEFHLIDTGDFALEDKADEMVPLIRGFLDRNLGKATSIEN